MDRRAARPTGKAARDTRRGAPGELNVDWSDPDDQFEVEPEPGDFDFERDWDDQ
ncbi:MAG: hypothetical protein AB7O59_14050 [Pirellulales bacterium]